MKRLLLVTYYFPPSGGPGVQRPLKFAKYLPEFGWEPVILTVDPESASYPDIDEALLDEIPDGVDVIRTRSWDPYAAYARLMGQRTEDSVGVGFLGDAEPGIRERLARWVRANIFLPDARVGWVRFAVRAGKQRMKQGDIDAVLTTGPPQSAHMIGEKIVEDTDVPWVADLRDLWPDPSYLSDLPMTPWARRRDARIRNRVLGAASARIAVTDEMARVTREQTGNTVNVIPNGYDPEDFDAIRPETLEGCALVHTGNLPPARNPSVLWDVLKSGDDAGKWPQLNVVLVGNVDASVRKSIHDRDVQHRVRHVPYVPHERAIAYMKGADILLLPINQVEGAAGIVTGKIFEYLATGKPIMCIGPTTGEAAEIIRRTSAGATVDYGDVRTVEDLLDRWYDNWEANRAMSGAPQEEATRYSRRRQTRTLADLLDDLTGDRHNQPEQA